MPLAIPPELKKIQPFIRRAEELDRDKTTAESRLVAYYLRQYAVHTGIPLASNSAAAKTCLGHVLEVLEREKPAMDPFTRDEAAFLCRKFAMAVFDKADGEDRSHAAGKHTAKTFYAAASFLQILEQFYPADPGEAAEDRAQDRKRILYAKWKAMEILKAIKEGRTPTPGGFDPEAEEVAEDTNEDEQAEGAPAGVTKKQDAPVVAVVTDDQGVRQEETVYDLPPAPIPMSPPPPPGEGVEIPPPPEYGFADPDVFVPPPPQPPYEDAEEPDAGEESEGQEVELGPPPAYPGPVASSSGSSLGSGTPNRPKITFELPPPVESKPLPPPNTRKSGGGFFGLGVVGGGGGKDKKKTPITKAQISDATELTRFALAALEDKDAELAADRLRQALNALGR